ncbi:DUF4394 domain-containing protein [Virgisporangium ochraceum]|uniref:DUF4394 domain-containing protein n=1 Tax=Virgisporangium ochraceum TaxID=65505 RepID=A0A8J4EEA5_9ACTN|nr:DUF4394 domain-containing protein [Virgisporangium ochraceum]GIJ72385.1 hypothetical protein Voc01_073020 [Virgisporangium ochraceum]
MIKRWIVGGMIAALGVGGGAAGYALLGPDEPALFLASDYDETPRLRAIGLTADQRLVGFRVEKPSDTRNIGKVDGLTGDTRLVGIDYRVQDGKLYGVGEAGGVYQLGNNAKATKVSQLTVPLQGRAFGVDFNPAADRLRIVSDTGQNLRHDVNPKGVTVADTALSYPPAMTAPTGVVAAAYTNNDRSADTGTALYDLDVTMDQVAIQSPANSGQLVPTGKLGVDAASAGFDIYSMLRGDRTVEVYGFAAVTPATGSTAMYRVSLVTGQASKVGEFGVTVTDLALPLNQ